MICWTPECENYATEFTYAEFANEINKRFPQLCKCCATSHRLLARKYPSGAIKLTCVNTMCYYTKKVRLHN